MYAKCMPNALMGILFLIGIANPCRAVTVATVGDSFADSLYNAIRSRPDLVLRYDIHLTRWSRPIVGLTRTDYFDYVRWLRDSTELGSVDVCLVQIGSNDMQSIPAPDRQWIVYGSKQWKETYANRTREMARILTKSHCGLLVWVLQPGFEKHDVLACHRELINEVQREALVIERTRVLEPRTSDAAYGHDKTHFNRDYVLQLGLALFQIVDTSRQILHRGCLNCHQKVDRLRWTVETPTLKSWQEGMTFPAWAPERVGIQCRLPVPRRELSRNRRKPAHPRRAV